MDSDPTPGRPDEVRELAEELQEFADNVGEALGKIRGMASDRAVLDWAGLTADAFRTEFDGVPENLTKLQTSYDMAADALARYWPKLESAQALADRALERAIAAQADLQAAQGELADGQDWVSRAGDEAERLQDQARRESTPEPPSEEDVRTAVRDHQAAEAAATAAQGRVSAAEDALAAARELARQAQEMREEAARECARDIDAASDAGIHNRRWWERAIDWVRDNWDTIVDVCKLIVAVLGVVVMIIGGPLAWVVLAAALIVLADTLVKYARGQATLLDVAFAALDCIPGMKGLTTLGGLARGMRSLATTGMRGLRQGVLGMGRAVRRMGRSGDNLVCRTDPIDMATGEMVMSAVDVELPGVLPLVLERHHRTSLREGTWFGPSWASTLDQRLVLDEAGLRFVTADGMVLDYPRPLPDEPVMPVEGPRWGLFWNGDPGTAMTVHQPGTGRTLHFAPVPGRLGGELPLTAITDRNNNTVRVTYDASGAPAEVVHDGGYRIGVTTEAGRITAYRLLNGPDQPLLLRFGYDEHGNLAQIYNSSGLPHTFGYDDRHRITGWEDRNGTWYRYTYDDEGRCAATDGTGGFLSSRIVYDTDTHRTLFTDSLGHTTVYQFNDSYQLTTETDPLGHHTSREWDRYDRLRAVTDPLGQTTRYRYDERGWPAVISRPDGSQEVAENNELGLPVSVTRADGHVWQMEYDARGNLTAETAPTGARTSYRYNTIGTVNAITDTAGRTVLLETDAAGMPVASTDAQGARTRYERDAFGRLVAQVGPDGQQTRYRWTPEGKLSHRVLPDGTDERRVYDPEGNLVEHIDTAGRATRFAYTGFDLPATRIDPDGSRLEFTYDTELRLTSVTNQLGSTWRYFYDAVGRLSGEEDFGGRAQCYRHDEAGRLAEVINGAGESTRYVRNHLGKIVAQHTPEDVVTYAYDPLGNVRHVHSRDVELTYERDAVGRVLAETCNGATVRTTYDVLGRRVRRVTPSGAESLWEYDGRDRPVLLRTAGRTVTFAYDAAGREVERRAGSSVLAQTWDDLDRLSTQTLTTDLALEEPRRVQHRAYGYRSDGTIGTIRDLLRGDRDIATDRAGRVTEVQAATWTERYAYDAAGNLMQGQWQDSQPTRPASPNGTAHAAGNVSYEYDAQGRVVVRRKKRLSRKPDVWRYTWDSQDRLVTVITPDGTRWTYRYDPFGRRTAKQRLGPDGETVVEEVRFAWDGFMPAEQLTLSGDETLRCTVWDWERDRFSPVTQIERVAPRDRPQEWIDEQFYSIVTDLVGTPAELIDEQGELAWYLRTTVWGAALSTAPESDRAYCPLRFPGQYHDPETGLNYNYHRHYDPETGQYASVDPLGLAAGPNPRAYVPNPFTALDPLGLAPDCEQALQAARNWADVEQARPGANKHTRPTSAAGLSVPGHQGTFSGASVKGGGDHPDLHPDVQAAYDRVPAEQRAPGNQHGRCGEAEALSNALHAGVDPRGGAMAAVNVRAPGNPAHGTPKPPCNSCQHVLDQFGITAVT
ncbi:DUF6531 domain-containing protein [Streptomyces sp. NBC_01803]|uniref:DUF6531 domain-containing protein n=1 Tax=Streptomyces sp. NBC_01803 TaxID=2975946 RepID=UPI002DD7F431|nr:DUF6531 domain-containing protein [Streptomyces sp. NBC_01803]WSA46446.1 DUF6531 domain-containing protein [Streptomyces sp. NBC_01803]